jgi:hypothetical protein
LGTSVKTGITIAIHFGVWNIAHTSIHQPPTTCAALFSIPAIFQVDFHDDFVFHYIENPPVPLYERGNARVGFHRSWVRPEHDNYHAYALELLHIFRGRVE